MASRRQADIETLAAWISECFLQDDATSVLDLGCGPGLYCLPLSRNGRPYLGLDFGPASIEYAQSSFGADNRRFVLADVVTADFGGPHGLALMLYGEFNVFPPAEAMRLLEKSYEALAPGGVLLLEVYDAEAVRGIGALAPSWFRAEKGLFADSAHLCLTESRWQEEQALSRQLFHIIDAQTGAAKTYTSTTKAWTDEQYHNMLAGAGFSKSIVHTDWPGKEPSFKLIAAHKA